RNAPWVSLSQPSCASPAAARTSGSATSTTTVTRSPHGARGSARGAVSGEAMDGLLPEVGTGEQLAERLDGGDAVQDPVERVEQGEQHEDVQAALEDREHVHVDRQRVAEQEVEQRQVQQPRREDRREGLGPGDQP